MYTSARSVAAIWATFICAALCMREMCCNCKNNVWLCGSGFELLASEAFSFAARGFGYMENVLSLLCVFALGKYMECTRRYYIHSSQQLNSLIEQS
jgi:hypothetical protein